MKDFGLGVDEDARRPVLIGEGPGKDGIYTLQSSQSSLAKVFYIAQKERQYLGYLPWAMNADPKEVWPVVEKALLCARDSWTKCSVPASEEPAGQLVV